MLVAREILDHRRLQQSLVEIATAAERPEPSLRVGEVADRGLRPADLALSSIRIALLSERYRVRKSVIADPVAFVMGPRRQPPAFRVAKLLADHEEGRLDAAFAQDLEHARRHAGLGTIVECQRQVEHTALRQVAGCRAVGAISSVALCPARVPVCQIEALRSIHLIAALKAIAIASTSSTPANTCGLSRMRR